MSPIVNFFSEHGKKWLMTVISFTVLCAVFGVLAYELTKKPVTVVLDGEKQQISAHADTVGELLRDLQVDVQQHDVVKPGMDTKLQADMTISWLPAVQVKVSENGKDRSVWTTAKTVGGLLEARNITLGDHDKLSLEPQTKITKGMEISYLAGFKVDLNVAGKKHTLWTTATASTTVGDFLEKRDIEYDKNDRVKPGVKTPLTNVNDIKVTRIKKITDVVEAPIDYAVITRKDDSIPKGEKKVVSSGEEGKIAKTYAVIMENGKEVSRDLIETKTVEESEDRVVVVGTKVISQPSRGERSSEDSSSESESSSSHSGKSASKQFYVSSTAYTANCGGCSGITSTGINLNTHPNAKVIAVDPDIIPLGTKVWVQGYGYAVAADTGGAINGHKIDVFFSTKGEAYDWGTRTVLIKILD
ncbi:MAG TPA: ubiquitin-like domain-containing protein [Bacillales bacterium]|nr:ubiquitin-like domain-containing protein [Bacillales bacterium]